MRKTKRKQVGVRYLRLFQLEELNQITEDISGKNKEHTMKMALGSKIAGNNIEKKNPIFLCFGNGRYTRKILELAAKNMN